MHCLPLISNPVGWAVLGISGILLYKAGKKAGEKKSSDDKVKKS